MTGKQAWRAIASQVFILIKDTIISIKSKDGTQVAYKYIDESGKPYFKIEPEHEKKGD